ncbi:MAG: MFS transporter [Planctomycetes bacterium]|nr:MFS transporter [Planctomycetota bacterium]
MTPPPLFLLQLCNALISLGSILALMLATVRLTAWEWPAWQIGLVTTLANLCYGGLVFIGGRLADHWGRARSGILGAGIGLGGAVMAIIDASPFGALAAAMCGMAGAAMFFPGSAGLFSDAASAAGGPPPALHRKIRRYNLGWAAGNLASFIGVGLLVGQPHELAYGIAALSFIAVAAALWDWRHLTPRPTAPSGDRSPHPALPHLTIMYRVNLFVACILGMALMTQLPKAFDASGSVGQTMQAARLASAALSGYATCYILMFLLLGQWTGWVLKPQVLWACQAGFLLGSAGLLLLASWGEFPLLAVAACGGLIGSGYGAAYVGSIYYSLRLPEGVGRAAGWHETFIGMGNTMGPLLAGLFMSFVCRGITGLAIFLLIAAVVMSLIQGVMIPGARRLGAR